MQITGKRCNALLLSEGDWRAIQETLHLVSIAGMSESILDGMATCLSLSFLLTKQAQTHQYSAPVLRAAFAAILYCPVHGYFIGSQSLKQVAPQSIWLFQESLLTTTTPSCCWSLPHFSAEEESLARSGYYVEA